MDAITQKKAIDNSIEVLEKLYDENMKRIAIVKSLARANELKEENQRVMNEIKKLVDKRKAVK